MLRGGLVPVPGANYRCCAHVTFYFYFFFVFFPNWSVASIFVFLHSSSWQHAGEQKKKRFTLDWLFPFVSTASLIFPLCICFVLVPFRLLLEFINFFVSKIKKCIFSICIHEKKTKQNEYSRGWKEVGSVSLDRYITVATFESFNSRGASFFSRGPGRLIQVSVFVFVFVFFIMTVDRKHVSL